MDAESDARAKADQHGTIVALVDEAGDLDHVLRAGIEMVEGSAGARLILYDASSASAFTEPVAAPVSAEGVADEYGSLLSPEDLDKLGRPEVARRVRDARARGIDAWGRLASDHGIEPLMEFARSQDADLVLLPEELGDPTVLERLRGDTIEDAEESAEVPYQVVARGDGRPPQR
jgi:hypothetical protein